MQKARLIHLYLGCFFAPMLLFFAASGIWQTLGLTSRSKMLALLTTIHTSGHLKLGSLTSSILRDFVLVMSAAFIITIILGLGMAWKSGRNRLAAATCFLFGGLIPLATIAIRALK